MYYNTCHYESPLGGITLACDEEGLTGLWFDGQKYFGSGLPEGSVSKNTEQPEGPLTAEGQKIKESFKEISGYSEQNRKPPVLEEAVRWLDSYFSGRNPDFTPPLHLEGSDFRLAVWAQLLEIPYGQTTTYKEIARKIAEQKGIKTMSAQAVGGAVGHNPVSIIVPCHRVLGTDGGLTGYAGGLDKKISLLTLEKAVFSGRR